ncbi:male-specific protein scotti [Drosophila tropicalis]|uniref:male-specific protein scotti n=1 Tax=Drosophila tropicalis TaxID=46794 RepID=UPI0035AC233C
MANNRLMPDGQFIEEDMDGEDLIAREMDIDDDDDSESDGLRVMRLNNPQVAMLLDAPHEPPFNLHHMLGPVAMPARPRKKRSFLTVARPFHIQPEMCALVANGWQAMQHLQPEMRREYFANYMYENMNSKNYPNGEGLPKHWGQF